MPIARKHVVAVSLAGALVSGWAPAQFSPEEALFLQRWQRLQNDFDAGKLELDEQGLPIGLDSKTRKLSEQGLFMVSVRSRQTPLPFNQLHDWLVSVATPEEQPISDAEIRFLGGMPLHNHGFPTSPAVTGELEPGTYALEGIKFSMTGWWQLAFAIKAGDQKDIVSFDIVLQP